MAELTPAQQLHALLSPTTDEGQRAINEDTGVLKAQSERYQKALAEENPDQLKLTLGDITRKLTDAGRLDKNITADRVVDTFDFRPFEARPSAPGEETAAPLAPSLADFLPKESGEKGGGGTTPRDRVLGKLETTQKNEVMKEFDRLLATTEPDKLPDALENFYRTHLSAAGVLGRQYQILQDQTRKLYGGNQDEFNKHIDTLQQEANKSIDRLRETHQFGPMRDESLQTQRETEVGNIGELKKNTGNRDALRQNVESMFANEWERRQKENAFLDRFAHQLGDIGFQYSTYERGYDAIAATTYETQYQQQEEEPQPIPQGGPSGTAGGRGGRGKGAAKQAGKELEKGIKEGIQAGRAAATGAEAAETAAGIAAEAEAGESLFSAFLALQGTPIGWALDVIILFVIAFVVAIIIFMFILLIQGGVINPETPQASTLVAQNAKQISDNLCKTTVLNGPTVAQRCESSRQDLFDNINPGAAYPQPHATFPFLDRSLQSAPFGIQFIQPNGKTYWAYNRPFCTGNCFPWDYRAWGRYWCTDLVIDSYAAAGFTDIVGWSDPDYGYTHGWDTGNTSVMIKFFARNKGYAFMPASQFNPNKIASGSAIFFKWDNNPNLLGEHTGIVSGVQIDSNHPGFGVVNTIEANAWSKTGHYTFRNNNPGNQIVGFGIKIQQ